MSKGLHCRITIICTSKQSQNNLLKQLIKTSIDMQYHSIAKTWTLFSVGLFSYFTWSCGILVSFICFKPALSLQEIVITASPDTSIRVWGVANAQCGQMIRAHDAPVTGISLHATGDYLLSCSTDMVWRFVIFVMCVIWVKTTPLAWTRFFSGVIFCLLFYF